MNLLHVTERETIVGLLRLGWSIRRVSRETGRRHETIRRYGYEAGILTPGSAAKPHAEPRDLKYEAAGGPDGTSVVWTPDSGRQCFTVEELVQKIMLLLIDNV